LHYAQVVLLLDYCLHGVFFRWEFKEFLFKSVVLLSPQVIMLTMLYLGHKETHKEEK